MPTVIDSLLIELGLDSSKFNSGQKKAVEQLQKFDEANTKSNKNATQGAKELDLNLGKIRNSLIAIGTAVVGVSGFREFANQMIFGNAALGRTSALLGMNARDLDAWGKAAEVFGGDAKGVQASIQALEGGLAKFALGRGGEEVVTGLAQLGVTAKDGKVDLIELSNALKRVKDTMGAQSALTIGSSLGLDQGTLQMLMEGGDAVKALHDRFYDLSGVNDQNIKDAQELAKKWAESKQAGSALAQTIFSDLAPAMKFAVEGMTSIMDALNLSLKAPTAGEKQESIWQKLFGVGNLNKNEDDELKKIWANKPVFRDPAPAKGGASPSAPPVTGVKQSAAPVTLPSNLPRNLRNNNPGNIEYGDFAKKHGATGSDGRFAIFPTLQAGQDAQASLLMGYMAQGNNTISKIVSKWAPGSENNTGAYIADLSKKTGIDANSVLDTAQLGKVRQAMADHEGMVGARASASAGGSGGTNVETHIQSITVQTAATDATGVARDIGQAIKNNALINYSTLALQ
jgi:hypothetical protein